MLPKKAILGNALVREIVSARIDTLWKMLIHEPFGGFPAVDEEGATGRYDNKGAIFIPGGVVFQDVDEKAIEYDAFGGISEAAFRAKIRDAMRFDNATLLYPDGMASGVNLDSGFFSRAARRIYLLKKAAFRRKTRIGDALSREISSDDIVRSHCPTYMKPPYGARTRISTCVSIALVDSPMYFAHCKSELHLDHDRTKAMAMELDRAHDTPKSTGGDVLYPPFVVVCHDTRYKENSYTGLTRILGLGKSGEFATISMEGVVKRLTDELYRKKRQVEDDDIVASHNDRRIVCVLRIYAPTTLGKRSLNYQLHIVSPEGDLNIDPERIAQAAWTHYTHADSARDRSGKE